MRVFINNAKKENSINTFIVFIQNRILEYTKEKLLGMYLLERESMSGRALHLGMAELSGAGYESDARKLQELQRVTVADVKRVANEYLREPTLIMARPGGRFYFDW